MNERTFLNYLPESFTPVHIDKSFLQREGVDYPIHEKVNKELIKGSQFYNTLFHNHSLLPDFNYIRRTTDIDKELEIHNYTGICPTNVLEISPSEGACTIGCQYCLVTDGQHIQKTVLLENYSERLARSLKRNKDKNTFYYFCPKTEAFSETHLQSGMAHKIIKTFITHFNRYPESNIRLFIATKAGAKELERVFEGDSLFTLLKQLAGKVQINGSIGIMPAYLRDLLEPYAPSINERLELLIHCREMGIWAESVLCQPLFLPYLTKENISDFMERLYQAGVKNIKPEFFTAEIKNIVLIAQYIHHFDPCKTGEFFYPYLKQTNLKHIKQRSRLAPDKKVCAEKLELISTIANEYGIGISLCNWVKRELGQVSSSIHLIDRQSSQAGYRCLGYQENLFRRKIK